MKGNVVFKYNLEKSRRLRQERGLGFEEIIEYLESGHILDIYPHHNQAKYPGEWVYVVNVNEYAYLVPFVLQADVVHLKTLYRSRVATRKYLGGRHE